MFRVFCFLLTFVAVGIPSRITVAEAKQPEFTVDVMSVLSKAGCNSGACHGNLNGKGGLKLSLRGDDPQFDYHSLVLASRGRRVDRSCIDRSLVLQKATATTPHRGGRRIEIDSPEYQILNDWIRRGASGPSQHAPTVTRLDVEPPQVIVSSPEESVSVRVTAVFSDSTTRDVTNRACYELSNLIATVDDQGRVTREKFGETTLIVRYLQQQVPVSIAFIQASPEYQWRDAPQQNQIDRHIFAKLQQLRLNGADLCQDSVFVRRAYLDAIGRLPTADEAQAFVRQTSVTKRSELIDRLLSRPEFADFWALKWADILRTEEKVLDSQGVELFHQWIRESIAAGRPLDQFVRDLVLGFGSTYTNPPANYYRANREPSVRGETTARLFLGVRLQCAKCHSHPFDQWTQDDYYSWAACFSQIDYQVDSNERRDKLDKNEFVGEQIVLVSRQDELAHPNTGAPVKPKLLGSASIDRDAWDNRLEPLVDWLVSKDNQLFVKSQTNFIWYQLMGVGLVDPIDDFRLTNPASHPELLDCLGTQFADSGFDVRSLVRKIMNSRTYQAASRPDLTDHDHSVTYAHAMVRRLPAEVILDMQSDVLGTPAVFAGYPQGMRAVQVPGVQNKHKDAGPPRQGDRFMKTFGKPERILACDCERSNETTLKQALVLMGDDLNQRLAADDNQIQRWAASNQSNSQIIDSLYWTALSRPPSAEELAAAIAIIESPGVSREEALQDIAWALLNAKEFLFRK